MLVSSSALVYCKLTISILTTFAANLGNLQLRAFRPQTRQAGQEHRLLLPGTFLTNSILKLEVRTHLFAPPSCFTGPAVSYDGVSPPRMRPRGPPLPAWRGIPCMQGPPGGLSEWGGHTAGCPGRKRLPPNPAGALRAPRCSRLELSREIHAWSSLIKQKGKVKSLSCV